MKDKKRKSLLSEIITEYKNVTWASRSTVFQVTIIVLLITIFIATLITVFDFSLKYLLDGLSNLLRRVF